MADTSDAYGAFRNGKNYGSFYADFGGDYDAINSYSQGGAGGLYTVRGGETLEQIAYQLWGDSALWYKLAEANGLTAQSPLIEGRTLTIPAGVQRVHHNAGTVRPYDPAQALGDTSPTAAQKPKNNKCGVMGAILMAVVAVAVTIVATPVAAGWFSALGPVASGILGGAIAGAAGSVASQGLGLATGLQDRFSWKSLGMAALAGGVSGGLQGLGDAKGVFGKVGKFLKGGNVWKDGVRGVVSSALSQGAGDALGIHKFDFAGVAAAGIGSIVGGALGRGLDSKGGFFGVHANEDSFGYNLATSSASSLANAATRSAWHGENFGKNVMTAIPDAIGQAVGSSIANQVGKMAGLWVQKPDIEESPSEMSKVSTPREVHHRMLSAMPRNVHFHGADGGYDASSDPTWAGGYEPHEMGEIVVTGERLSILDKAVYDLQQVKNYLVDTGIFNRLGYPSGIVEGDIVGLPFPRPSVGRSIAYKIPLVNTVLRAQDWGLALAPVTEPMLETVRGWKHDWIGAKERMRAAGVVHPQLNMTAGALFMAAERALSTPSMAADPLGTVEGIMQSGHRAGAFVRQHGVVGTVEAGVTSFMALNATEREMLFGELTADALIARGAPLPGRAAATLARPSGVRLATAAKGTPLTFDKAARTWTTPEGLVYAERSAQGNRIKHVLEHTVPNPAKPVHSVFNVGRSEVLGVVDEAWTLRQGTGTLQKNGNRLWDVDMGRVVGTSGQTRVRVIVKDGTTQVITAFPR